MSVGELKAQVVRGGELIGEAPLKDVKGHVDNINQAGIIDALQKALASVRELNTELGYAEVGLKASQPMVSDGTGLILDALDGARTPQAKSLTDTAQLHDGHIQGMHARARHLHRRAGEWAGMLAGLLDEFRPNVAEFSLMKEDMAAIVAEQGTVKAKADTYAQSR